MSLSLIPPASPWGINVGGGLNSTALVLECIRRTDLRPDWMLFADTGSERPETIRHVADLSAMCQRAGLPPITTVRWIRQDGSFEALHDNCLRTDNFPSKAYGFSGCTTKWKVQPMERWRKAHGFNHGAFAVGYDAGETRRIAKACQRGDDPKMIAWYPLVAWGIDRAGCQRIVDAAGVHVVKSSCFMCPNMKAEEWAQLKTEHPKLYATAEEIERRALAAQNHPQAGRLRDLLTPEGRMLHRRMTGSASSDLVADVQDDRCVHGGCFT